MLERELLRVLRENRALKNQLVERGISPAETEGGGVAAGGGGRRLVAVTDVRKVGSADAGALALLLMVSMHGG